MNEDMAMLHEMMEEQVKDIEKQYQHKFELKNDKY